MLIFRRSQIEAGSQLWSSLKCAVEWWNVVLCMNCVGGDSERGKGTAQSRRRSHHCCVRLLAQQTTATGLSSFIALTASCVVWFL